MGSHVEFRIARNELIRRLALEAGVSKKHAETFYWAYNRVILQEILAGHEVALQNIGRFVFLWRAPRHYLNARKHCFVNGKYRDIPPMTIPGHYILKFKTAEKLMQKMRKVIPLNPQKPGAPMPLHKKLKEMDRERQARIKAMLAEGVKP